MHVMMLKSLLYLLLVFFLVCDNPLNAISDDDDVVVVDVGSLVTTKEQRTTLVLTESGQITAVDVNDGYRGPYHLQFMAFEPNSLFLPVLLQKDMVFYVHTGRGHLGWVDDEGMRRMELQPGDVSRLESGSIFYVQSHAEPMREKLRIYAFFTNKINEVSQETFVGAYSNISDMVLGFDERVLQMAFQVSEEVIEGIKKAGKPPSIVHMTSKSESEKDDDLDWKAGIMEALLDGGYPHSRYNGKKKKKPKTKIFNILKAKPDFENCNGWSLAVNCRDFPALKGSDIGVFMVNLTKGSMMGPHWNPRATEIAIVTHGQGMIRVVCSSNAPKCKNTRFKVKEGDVFMVPRYHPMAQISFNNESLVFVGFSTMAQNNRPQFLAGKRSVLQTINEDILAISFNVPNTTIRQFISAQTESIILECASCAEDEEKKMEEEIKKRKQEEEEARKREEEERQRREEEEARKREEEERKRREEEEAKKREEEEARKREEEERQRREEEEARKREEEEEEEARKREEEERKSREEEEAREREEEAKKKEEEERQRQEEEARREQEEARRQEEERQAKQREEEEEAKKQQEEARRQEEEEEERRREEEQGRKQGGGEKKVWKKMWKI